MYNRYVSQGDGSFQRSAMPDTPRSNPVPVHQQSPVPTPVIPPESPAPAAPPCPSQEPTPQEPADVHRFFSRLLPKNMDTGDLLMLLILLLLLSDGSSDAPPALLTLALYFLLKPEDSCDPT